MESHYLLLSHPTVALVFHIAIILIFTLQSPPLPAEPFIGDSVAAAVTGIDRGGQRWLMVAQAHLHRRKAEHAKALDCYLDSASCVGYTPPSSM